LGKWLTLTGFGKVDDFGEDARVSDWMLPKTEKVCKTVIKSGDIQFSGEIQPDTLMVVGWPATEQPPSGPTRTWTSANVDKIAVKLIIAEMGFTSDMSFSGTVTRKQEKYRTLIAAMKKSGLSVAPLTHVITVGSRATVPIRNANVLKELGIVKVANQKLCSRD
jgi:hypothetical protein